MTDKQRIREDQRRIDAERRLEAVVASLRDDACTEVLDRISARLETLYGQLAGGVEVRVA